MKPRILITCSRSWSEWSTVRRVLSEIHDRYPDAILVHGACQKGDMQVAGVWRSMGGVDEQHPVRSWGACIPECDHKPRFRNGRQYCPAAGPRRNARMVESGPDMCVAFIANGSPGATGTADLSEGAGIPTVRYVQEDHPIEGRHADQLTPGTAVRSYPYSKEEMA